MYEGKRCDDAHPCPEPLLCNPFTLTCARTTTCPFEPSEPAPSCEPRDVHLSEQGDDANDGLAPSRPRRTLSNFRLQPGDHVHVAAGRYTPSLMLSASGTPGCPMALSGADPAGTVVEHTVRVHGAHWRIRDLVFETADPVAISGTGDGTRLEGLSFRQVGSDGGFGDVFVELGTCQGCSVVGNSFDCDGIAALHLGGGDLAFRGNAIRGRVSAREGSAVECTAGRLDVEGNRFDVRTQRHVRYQAAGTGRVARNQLTGHASIAGVGSFERIEVTHNTIAALDGFAAVSVNPASAIRNNVFSALALGIDGPKDAGAYNLFDRVSRPYLSSTSPSDVGPLDLAGGLAAGVDAADPEQPVPAGGGARADIGATERGAQALPDGRYCVP